MATPIVIPKFGKFLIGQKVGQNKKRPWISKWMKEHGEAIEMGEVAVVVETTKATLEIQAPATGLLFHLKKLNEKSNLEETIGAIAESIEDFENFKQELFKASA